MTPLAFGPYVFWQVVWTGGLVWAQQSVLKRCGAPRGWKLGLLGIAVVLAVEPIRTTLGYGQVNTMLMALVVADLLPDRPGQRRRIPQGILIGLAAAIKLTPALFVIFMFLIGKRRAAITAIISFAVFTGIGAILLFGESVVFFGGLSGGDTRTASPLYTGNQSLLGVFFRLGDSSRTTTVLGLAVAGVLAVLGCLVAAHWWANNEKVFAVAIVGITTCLASPLSWTHHYVWILPLANGCAVSWCAALGAVHRRALGGLGVYLPAARRAPVRGRPGAAVQFPAAAGSQSRPNTRCDLARWTGLAAGGYDPRACPSHDCQPLTPATWCRYPTLRGND